MRRGGEQKGRRKKRGGERERRTERKEGKDQGVAVACLFHWAGSLTRVGVVRTDEGGRRV